MTVVNMHEAKSQLSKLVAQAEAGEEIIIARDGRPAVRLTPVLARPTPAARALGAWRGQVWMSDDFDDPMPELERAIYASKSETVDRMMPSYDVALLDASR